MTDELFDRIVVPLASPEDARATARALAGHLDGRSTVVAVNVVEKAGGAPDKASVEQREEYAEETFAAFAAELAGEELLVETELRYDTDVARAIVDAAADRDASAIVFTPRGGSRWIKLLTGNVTGALITDTDRPVVVLPDADPERDGNG